MISWLKLIPIAKIMFDTLTAVIQAETDKSSPGRITKEEIKAILLGQVENVVGTLGPGIVVNEKQQ